MPTPPPPIEHRWKPGQSGNPSGKPKTLSLVALLKAKLLETPDGMDGKTYAELLIQRSIGIALKDGDVGMIRDMMDRTDGKPKQETDVTSGGEKITALSGTAATIVAEAEEALKKAL